MRRSHVLSFKEQLQLISSMGFKCLDGYRKSEVLIGEVESVELIQICLSQEGKTITASIEEHGKTEEFLEKFKETLAHPRYNVSAAFVSAFEQLNL